MLKPEVLRNNDLITIGDLVLFIWKEIIHYLQTVTAVLANSWDYCITRDLAHIKLIGTQ
jgi:hypothetical protein